MLPLSLHHSRFLNTQDSECGYGYGQPTLPGAMARIQEAKGGTLADHVEPQRTPGPSAEAPSFIPGDDAALVSVSPSGRQAQSRLRPGSRPVPLSSFLLFMCAWFWFQWLSSVTETTPPHHFPGPRQARADRARPGVWATVNKAAGGPLRPALPRQARSPGWPKPGPRAPAAGARSLPGSTPEQGSLTPSSWLGVRQPQPGSLGQLGGDRGRSRPGAGAFAVASEAER